MNDFVHRNEHNFEIRYKRASLNGNQTTVQHPTIKQVARPPRPHYTEPLSILRVGGLDHQPQHYNFALDKNTFLVLNLWRYHDPLFLVERIETKNKVRAMNI